MFELLGGDKTNGREEYGLVGGNPDYDAAYCVKVLVCAVFFAFGTTVKDICILSSAYIAIKCNKLTSTTPAARYGKALFCFSAPNLLLHYGLFVL